MLWQTIALGQAVDPSSGTWGKPPAGDATDTPVLRSTNIHDGRLVLDDLAMRSLTPKLLSRYQMLDGDIIVTTSSGSSQLIGKCTIFEQPNDGRAYAFSNFTVRLRPHKAVVLPRYVYYYLLSPVAKSELERIHTTTSGLRNLNVGLYMQQSLPWTGKTEQRRIVEILDQAGALRKKRAEADAKAARILPALFYGMFGDLATNSKGWDVCSLGEVIESTRNGMYKPAEFYGDGVSILKMFNIQHGEIDLRRVDLIRVDEQELEVYGLLPNDILMNRVNTPELVGKCAVIPEGIGKAVFESKNIRMRVQPKRATPEYVASYLNSPFGHGSLRNGVKHAIGMATINNTDLRALNILVPPLRLQQQWTRCARTWRDARLSQSCARERLETLLQNLLHRAFSGELTVKWRESHMKELLQEMETQAKALEAFEEAGPVARTGTRRGRQRKG